MLIETLMKAYERIQAGPVGGTSSDKLGEAETPPTNDSSVWKQSGPSSQPPESTPTLLSASTTGGRTTVVDGNLMEWNVSESVPNNSLDLDGLMNLDQMGGLELFFSQPMWPENVLLGQDVQSSSGGAGAFDFRDLFGLYDTQPQF